MSAETLIRNARNLQKNRSGNFGLMTALLVPVLFTLAGFSVDYTGLIAAKARMRDASDAAALAASSAMAQNGISETDARAIAVRYLKAHALGELDFASKANISFVTTNVNNVKTYKVTVDTSYDYPLSTMTSLFGLKSLPVVSKSTSLSTTEVQETKSPSSLFLILDQSGSMGEDTNEVIGKDSKGRPVYREKMEALKIAVQKLATILKTVDPDSKFARTGAVAFSSGTATPTQLAWGTAGVVSYANALSAGGATNPVNSLKIAYTSLTAASENAAHLAKNGGVPTKAILYMTDGENNPKSLDPSAQANCTAAKKAGVEVYSVGFMVPASAVSFLSACATDSKHFFNAADAAELYAAFEKIGVSTASKMANRVTE